VEAYLTTDCADLLIFWKSLRIDILYLIHFYKTSHMIFGAFSQRTFASKSPIFFVAKKGLITVVVFVFFATACNEKSKEGPSRVDAPPAKSAEDQIELERIEKEREEQERKAESNDEGIRLKREEARRQAVGQVIAKLETLKGGRVRECYD
jgi:hypothetical protein